MSKKSKSRNIFVEAVPNLPMEEQRDLLRALLPPGSDSCISVHAREPLTPPGQRRRRSGPRYFEVEIQGLLPIEQAQLKNAVLGGALAVP